MLTASDLRKVILRVVGVKNGSEFADLSEEHRQFLFAVGGIYIAKGMFPGEVKDVDKASVLSKEEWNDWLAKLRAI